MAFCINCGKSIADGTKYCPACGASQEGTTHCNQRNQRRTVYEGEIHKCPSCGEILNSFMTNCPTCGYEIRGARTSNSISEFSLMLGKMQSDEAKSNFIRNYPIPNSKEDIYEFLILASTSIGGTLSSIVSEAWFAKVDQCYQKATLSFSNNDDLSQIKQIYDDCHIKLHKAQERALDKMVSQLIVRNLAAAIGIIAMIVAVCVNLSDGNSSLIELMSYVILIISASTITKRGAFISDFGIGALSGIITIVLSLLLDNSSMGMLGGGIVLIIVAVNYFNSLNKKQKNSNQRNDTVTNSSSNNNHPRSANHSNTNTHTSSKSDTNLQHPSEADTNTQIGSANSSNTNTQSSTTSGTDAQPNFSEHPNANTQTSSAPNTNTQSSSSHTSKSGGIFSELFEGIFPFTESDGSLIKVPAAVYDSTQNYATVEMLFIQAGFLNVKTIPLNDLTFGIMKKVGTVDSITINGKDLYSYFRKRFDRNAPVLITYHSMRKLS